MREQISSSTSEKFGSLELCRLHKDFSEIVIVTHLYDVPQLNLRLSRFRVTTSLLPYLLVIHCSVFKVQTPASFEARSQSLISKALRSNSKSLFGGPEWARTTDLAIISRTL